MEALDTSGFSNLVGNIKQYVNDKTAVNLEPFFRDGVEYDGTAIDGFSLLGDYKARLSGAGNVTFDALYNSELKANTQYTLLIDATDSWSALEDAGLFAIKCTGNTSQFLLSVKTVKKGSDNRWTFTTKSDFSTCTKLTNVLLTFPSQIPEGEHIDLRLSLYEGTYTGDYIPYDGSLLDVEARVETLEAHDVVQDGAIERAWKDTANANLSPFFQEPLDSPYYQSTSIPDSITAQSVGDGWIHIEKSASDTGVSLPLYPRHFDLLEDGSYTLLIEIENYAEDSDNFGMSIMFPKMSYFTRASGIKIPRLAYAGSETGMMGRVSKNFAEDGAYPQLCATTQIITGKPFSDLLFLNISPSFNGNFVGSLDLRMSLFKGDRTEDSTLEYVPFDYLTPYGEKLRTAILEAQNATQDATLSTQAAEIALAWRGPLEHENLTPFFSVPLSDTTYWLDDSVSGMVTDVGDFTCTKLDEGWMRFETSDASGAVNEADFYADMPDLQAVDLESFSLLIEARNIDGSGVIEITDGANGSSFFPDSSYPLISASGKQAILYIFLDSTGYANPIFGFNVHPEQLNPFSGSFELRLSLYRASEGVTALSEYSPYDPGSPIATKHRVAALETSQESQDTELARAWKRPDNGVNLYPFFASPGSTVYNYPDLKRLQSNGSMTMLSDGWAQFNLTAMGATPVFSINVPNLPNVPDKCTLLLEFDCSQLNTGATVIVSGTGGRYSLSLFSFVSTTTSIYVPVIANTSGINASMYAKMFGISFMGGQGYLGVRASLYPGEYTGEYVAYNGYFADFALMNISRKLDDLLKQSSFVFLNPNGGTGGNYFTVLSHVPFVIPGESTTTATRTPGYELSKWNTAADGSGTDYAIGDTVVIDSDLTLYAIWTAV